MRYDREITFLLREGLKDADRQRAAAELLAVLTDHRPAPKELDAIEARLAAEAGKGAVAAYQELREAIGFKPPIKN
jgi:hypothetical protein